LPSAQTAVTFGHPRFSAYHYSMFFTEVLRLGELYPDRIAELNATYSPAE
jgi:hypothetical protein